MLQEVASTLSQLCHMAGLLILLYGALLLIGAAMSHGSAMGFVKGGLLILLGAWFSGLAG